MDRNDTALHKKGFFIQIGTIFNPDKNETIRKNYSLAERKMYVTHFQNTKIQQLQQQQ